MTLKPPTRTFPKLVMKEWPVMNDDLPAVTAPDNIHGFDPQIELERMRRFREKSLSDFPRVVEETGVLDQKETPLRKRASDHD